MAVDAQRGRSRAYAGGRHLPGARALWRGAGLTAVAALLVFMAVYPVGLLFLKSFQVSPPYQDVEWGLGNWTRAFDDPGIASALVNTFSLGIVRVVLAGAIGIAFAWLVTRTNAPGRRFIEVSLWFGFFLPLLPLTFGWLLLLDPQSGLVNTALQSLLGLEDGPLDVNSWWGIVWAHLAHSSAIMFLLVTPAFQRMDAALEEAAWVSGSGRARTLMRVTVPVLAPAILVALILILIRSFESFEIELLLGAPSELYVFSTKVWLYLRLDPPQYGQATALSVVFLILLLALVVVQRRMVGRRDYTTLGGRGVRLQRADLGRWRWPAGIAAIGFIVISVFLPMAMLVLGTFMRLFGFFDLENPWTTEHWQAVLSNDVFVRSLVNTLIVGVGAAVAGALFYVAISRLLARGRFRGRGLLDVMTWLPWALPGVLIGLALLWTVLGSIPVLTALYGSVFVLMIAIIIKNLPLGVQMMKASVLQIGTELEESAHTSGASAPTTFRRIVLPLLAPGTLSVALIVFIEAVREIPAVIFLADSENQPLSPLMLAFAEDGQFEAAAITGLIVTVVIAVAALLVRLLGRRFMLDDTTR